MLKCLLAPAALLYKAGVTFRHRLFDWGILKSEKFDIPVICIGNITVGGTGKTPMAEMVIAYMSQMHRVALLSRGYGRRTKGYLEVKADSHYRDVGDEPLQIKLKFPDTVVAVCEKRAEGIRRIRAGHPDVDLVVMDDGFQHRYVEPKVNIVMIDATRPVQHDRMLPLGTLRDLPEELHRAGGSGRVPCRHDGRRASSRPPPRSSRATPRGTAWDSRCPKARSPAAPAGAVRRARHPGRAAAA